MFPTLWWTSCAEVVQFQAASEVVFHVFGTIAQFECWLISERCGATLPVDMRDIEGG